MVISSAILFITILINLILAIFIYFKTERKKSSWFYLLLLFSVIFWALPLFVYYYTASQTWALLLSKTAYVAATASALFFFYFCLFFPQDRSPLKPFVTLLMPAPFLVFVFFVYFSDYIIAGFTKFNAERIIAFGPVYASYALYIAIYFFLGFLALFLKYKKTKNILLKVQIKYISLGFFITVVFATFFNLVLPTFGNFDYYQVGPMWTLAMVVFVAYAITRHHLFNIRVVITELLVGLVSMILLVDLLLAEGVYEVLLKLGIFLAFVYLGVSLIRSVLREIERREKVERLSQQLRRAYAQLKKLDAAKSEFISIASHQLRTPLTIIKGYISMAQEGFYGEMPEKAKRPLVNVFESNERLIKLVNELLTLSKIEAGKLEMNFEKAKLEDLMIGLVEEFKLKAKEKKIYLRWQEPEKPLPEVFIDVGKMRQVFLNILDNGIRYTARGGLEISSKVNAEKIRIIIKDTGAGMTKDEISKIFSSFSRGTTGRKISSEGAGLGLYVAKKYVKMHKGRIWVESAGRNKGSTFFIELPITKKRE